MLTHIFDVVPHLISPLVQSDSNNDSLPKGTEEVVPGNNHKILVAYFSKSLPDGVDTNTSASRVVVNGKVSGSV